MEREYDDLNFKFSSHVKKQGKINTRGYFGSSTVPIAEVNQKGSQTLPGAPASGQVTSSLAMNAYNEQVNPYESPVELRQRSLRRLDGL